MDCSLVDSNDDSCICGCNQLIMQFGQAIYYWLSNCPKIAK